MLGTTGKYQNIRNSSGKYNLDTDECDPKKGMPVVHAATGYTYVCGRNYILIFNEALWMPELRNSLINSNQLRNFKVEVQDNPYSAYPMKITSSEN